MFKETLPFKPGSRAGSGTIAATPEGRPGIFLRNNESLESEEHSEPLTSQFHDMLLGVDLCSDHHCAACLGNRKLRPLLEKVDNTGQKVYRFS
ncbi:MAG: hypothetical protein ACOX6B_04855 [Thermoguttaceae bacterium]